MEKINSMQRSMYVTTSKISTAKLSATSGHIHICKAPILMLNETVRCCDIDSVVAVQSLFSFAHLKPFLQCGLR